MEGIMTKEMCISLLAATALFAMGTISIGSAIDGRLVADNQPDAMVTQLYASDAGDLQNAVADSTVPRHADRADRGG
jgi:hypothetical protein